MTTFEETRLLSLVSSVGRKDEFGIYFIDAQCAETLQDILKFLRQDSSLEQHVACQLLAWNFVSKDLLPILRTQGSNETLIVHVLKIIIFLTLPVDTRSRQLIQFQNQQLSAIDAILDDPVVTLTIFHLLAEPLEKIGRGKSLAAIASLKRIELVFTFVRNIVLAVVQTSCGPHGNISVREERVLHWFFECSVIDLFAVAQELGSEPFRVLSFLLIEIVSCLCTSASGKNVISLRYIFESSLQSRSSEEPKSQQEGMTWRKNKIQYISRFNGRYRHDSVGVVCTSKVHIIPKINCSSTKSVVSITHSERKLAAVLNVVEELHLNSILCSTWKHMCEIRGIQDQEEHSVHVHDFLKVLTYFMSFINTSIPAVEKEIKCATFSKIFNRRFIPWLKTLWITFETQRDTNGILVMNHFLHDFMQLLEFCISSGNGDIKLAGSALAYELVGSSHETRVSEYLVKTLKSTSNINIEWTVTVENLYQASVLRGLLTFRNPNELCPGSRVVTNHAWMKNMFKHILSTSSHSETATRSTLYLLQQMKSANPSIFHQLNTLVCYSDIFRKYGNQKSGLRKLQRFISDELTRFLKRLRRINVTGSDFLSIIFTTSTTLVL